MAKRVTSEGLYWLADRMAPAVKVRFLEATRRLQTAITVKGLLSNSLDKPLQAYQKDLRRSTALIEQVFTGSMEREGAALSVRLGARFDIINPRALEAARFTSSLLIREITEQTRTGIQRLIRSGIEQGLHPYQTAKLIKPMIGLTQRQGQAVMAFRQNLIDGGLSSQKAAKLAGDYAHKKLNERAATIARTETIRASNDGQLAAWREARAQNLLTGRELKIWIAADDERLCPICKRLDDQKGIALDARFFTVGMTRAVDGPPAHPRCRCAMGLKVSRTRARAA